MWKRSSSVIIAMFFVIGFSFALDTSTAIDNPSFEDVYLNETLGNYFPEVWYIGSPFSSQLTEEQLYHLEKLTLNGIVSLDAVDGTYSYANMFYPAYWNSSFTYNEVDVHAYQNFQRNRDRHFIVSGSYKIPTDYAGNESLVYGQISFGGLIPEASGKFNIIFNSTNYDVWENFTVDYDNGVCTVLGGDVNCTTPQYADIYTMNIYTYFDYQSAQQFSNETTGILVDNLEIDDVSELEGVGDYYDQYVQSLDGFDSDYDSCGFRPLTTCIDVYSGKFMDSMKTRYLNISSTCAFKCSVGGGFYIYTYISGIQYKDSEGNWIQMLEDDFEQHFLWNSWCYENSCSASGDGENPYSRVARWQTEMGSPFASTGLILPKEAREIIINYTTRMNTVGSPNYYYTQLSLNLSDDIQYSSSPIDTSLANQSQPTFFPTITQFINQNGKNLTSFELMLPFWFDDDYDKKIDWINNSVTMETYNTGTIQNQSYAQYSYDTSAWGIQTDDWVNYATTTDYTYFGQDYHPSSIYLFNSEDEDICPPYCQLGSYFEGEYVNGFCYYTEYSCDERCLPNGLVIEITELNPTEVWFNFTSYDTNYWRIEDDNSTVIDSGSISLSYDSSNNVEPETEYTLYVNASKKYGCSTPISNSTSFTTPATTPIPDSPYSDYITNGTQTINTWIGIGITAFATSLGINEVIAKSMIWLIITLIASVLITKSVGQVVPAIDPFAVLGVSALILIAIGFLLGWLGVLWVVLIGTGIGIFLFREFNKTVV
jgi:hypothetical protein